MEVIRQMAELPASFVVQGFTNCKAVRASRQSEPL